MSPYAMSLSFLFVISVLIYLFYKPFKRGPLPPGPKAHPFVGHTFQIPTAKTWKYFETLFHQFGASLLPDVVRCGANKS